MPIPSPLHALSRRRVLGGSLVAAALSPVRRALAAIQSPLSAEVGIQLYSVKALTEKGPEKGLAAVKRWGFRTVEGGVPSTGTPEEYAKLLRKHGLRMASVYSRFVNLENDLGNVLKATKAMGASFIVSGSIPHDKVFTRKDCDRAIEAFPKWARAARDEGLGFAYHIHGAEFEPSPDGTLMDTLIKSTPADLVGFEADVFWIARGGCNPAELLERHAGRFPLLHLKDIAKGTDICHPNDEAPLETSVPLGQGMIDWPAVLRAAEKGKARHYFIEDEHPDAVKQIPISLAYLRRLKL
jgi:sugar phosphate isomerase/epimerase